MNTGADDLLRDTDEDKDAQPPPESFVIRFWVEPGQRPGGGATWSGRITHVATRETRQFRDLGAIAHLIRPFLARAGVGFGRTERARRWLRR